ncbi:type 2 isopentenyl-diphosphate Delta-isomerase [Fictibacillus terranigra]|uniref:Isopentenyl-diphosphate delta-isomerase n=1 Tax=Fictibacillus terranigra TaxID=3058424 RepID=A0ABT8E0N8_9BACL|nr:type 2 isopentenyl-diphosphate Delta-isomerase [Fictibacillus sp. CENA-BCM004]MDN4071488.1 type 2 isopentenyl-diphosphate Delta-isomerase [Fictibacillus sp. CENA-BCM004]
MSHDYHNTEKRKNEHIEIALNKDVTGNNITTGFENYRFKHNALPEINFTDIDLSSVFLGKPIKAPFLISSMTGGTMQAYEINKALALAAEAHGWAIGLGSMRAAIENEGTAYSFRIRKYAPSAPIIANLGAVQLNYGYGIKECRRAVEIAEADGLVLHLNGLQEIFQPEGDVNFSNLLKKIEDAAKNMPVPLGVKEVGMGIDRETAQKLIDAGVQFIDVAGAGGTSWIQVEKYRSKDRMRERAAEAFQDWGYSTAEALLDVRNYSADVPLIASGGLNNGVDAAKALSLGANLAGFGRTLLREAVDDEQAIHLRLNQIEFELRTAMFGIGAVSLAELASTTRLKKTIIG